MIEHREGGDNTTVRKLPGKTTYSDITLKWGLTDSHELWSGAQQVDRGRRSTARTARSSSSTCANSDEVARWNFVRAWPTKWEGPAFNAKGNDIAIETLVLAHEGIERA